ncbi:MAG: serine/threonine-protein kinase, partial [Phycisphaerae bacterium]
GIVHRDVKPGNIMIDDAGQVKLTDFGLADVQGMGDSHGRAMGTPGWISPEVARGQRATPASDIYGLGLTLYYALTRKRLIKAETKSGMIRMQREARSVRLEDLPGGWPPRLREIVARCLEADPADRYQSADALAADLLCALSADDRDSTIVLDRRHGTPPRLIAPVLGWIVLGGLLLLAVVLAVDYWLRP